MTKPTELQLRERIKKAQTKYLKLDRAAGDAYEHYQKAQKALVALLNAIEQEPRNDA